MRWVNLCELIFNVIFGRLFCPHSCKRVKNWQGVFQLMVNASPSSSLCFRNKIYLTETFSYKTEFGHLWANARAYFVICKREKHVCILQQGWLQIRMFHKYGHFYKIVDFTIKQQHLFYSFRNIRTIFIFGIIILVFLFIVLPIFFRWCATLQRHMVFLPWGKRPFKKDFCNNLAILWQILVTVFETFMLWLWHE
jgi:hypothetical protein